MRRGQAALEYLVTYGWAFIAILVVVGALAYFGFLSPTKYLPARCEFGAQLECVDYALYAADAGANNGCVLLQFHNNFGVDVNITEINLPDNTGVVSEGALPDCGGAAIANPIRTRQGNTTRIISVTIPTGSDTYLTEGDRFSVRLRVEFMRDVPDAPKHNVSGEIFATVTTG